MSLKNTLGLRISFSHHLFNLLINSCTCCFTVIVYVTVIFTEEYFVIIITVNNRTEFVTHTIFRNHITAN